MAELSDALRRLAQTDRLLVALDFDGTLAPLVDDPAQSRAVPRARSAVLGLLDAPHTRVALISGRAMASLRQVSQLPDNVLLSGSHGIEVMLDSAPKLTLTPDETARADALRSALETAASGHDGAWVEVKPAGFALHTRLASEAATTAAREAALAAVTGIRDLTVRRGADVLEFSVRPTNKGDAVRALREYSGATGVFFAGDDVTDEDAFAALGDTDLGLKCGEGNTIAEFRVASINDVADVLHQLIQLRGSARLA